MSMNCRTLRGDIVHGLLHEGWFSRAANRPSGAMASTSSAAARSASE
jgi:hypothetical protein